MRFTVEKENKSGDYVMKTSYQPRPGTSPLIVEFKGANEIRKWDISVKGAEIFIKGISVAHETNPDNCREIVHLILFVSLLKEAKLTLDCPGPNKYSITNDR